jgi:glycosyltransferase involved in cell wall biosynthesis
MSAKVLLIAPQPFFQTRGTPINVREMARTLGGAGYELHLLAYPYGEEIELSGVTLFRCFRPPWIKSVPIGPSCKKIILDSFIALSAFKLAFSNRYKIYHGVEEAGFIAGVLRFLFGGKYIYDMDSCMYEQLVKRNYLPTAFLRKIFWKLESFFIKKADAVLTVCKALSDKARELAPHVLICQIEDFPEDSISFTTERESESLKLEFKLESQLKIFVYTGNFEFYQGIDLLLESFAKLKTLIPEEFSNYRLFLVGGGDLESEIVKKYVEKTKSLSIAGQVIFTGNRPGSEMGAFLKMGDILVSPRIEGENTPLKVYGYMAAEKIIVATDIRSHTQVLNSSNSILSLATRDSFAAGLFAAVDPANFEMNSSRARMAKELVEKKYSRNSFESRLKSLYSQINAV